MTARPACPRLGALLVLLAAPLRTTQAQGDSDLVTRAVRAYQNVEFDAAATLLRRALADNLAPDERTRALTYLGAAEVFRGGGGVRRVSAVAAFRRRLLLDPRQRPDRLVFPPQVVSVFEEVRRATKAVLAVAPAESRFRPGPGGGSFVATLFGTSFHEIEVRLARVDGTVVRTLYVGPMGDSLEVRWDGLDTAGAFVPSGRYVFTVASRLSPASPVLRVVQLPLETGLVVPDTLPVPPPPVDSLLLPEKATRGMGFRSLAGGLLAAGAVIALPPLVADGANASGIRFAVAGAVSFSGLVGFVTQRPGRALPGNIAANQGQRDAWRRRADAAQAENAARRREARLTVRVGTPVVMGGERP